MEGKDIRCFQHCDRKKNILCFSVPQICPLCGGDTTQTEMRIPPYLIESPFTDARYSQCSILVKPTIGHFLYSFDNSSDLHIGVSNSSGVVYEFDERGVVVGGDNWSCCLTVDLQNIDTELWDKEIEIFGNERKWSAYSYNEAFLNCYDFVIGFLRSFGLESVYPCLRDKLEFCEKMILPVTSRAGKYISLYRTIEASGYVIQHI